MYEASQSRSIRPHEWLLLAAGGLLLLRYGWLMDDAFVYFRYADNALFLNRGLVYNPGEFVEGFSSPLWMLLLLPLRWIGLEYWWIVRLVGLGSFALFWLLAVRIHRRLSPAQSPVWNLPLVFLALSYPVLSHFSSGLETPLLQLSAAVVGLAALEPERRGWDFAVAPLPLLRHELLPVVLLLIFFRWQDRGRLPWRLLGLTAGLFLAWLLFRIDYYAALLPNTFHLKMGLAPAQGLRYAWQVVGNYGLLPLLALHGLLLFWPRRDRSFGRRARLWLLATPQLIYVILIGGDWVHYRFLAFPIPLLLLSLGGVLEGAAATRRKLGVACVVAAGTCSLFAYPPQLEKPALLGMSHVGEPEERLVDSVYDANAHRRQPDLLQSPWQLTDPRDPLRRYDAAAPVREVVVEGWCHEAFQRWDARVVHRWGLTDPVLARIDVPAALSGHRYALRSFAEDLAAARGVRSGPIELGRSEENPSPDWMFENEDTLHAIERRMFNRHRLFENLRLALSPVGRIQVDWGGEAQADIVLIFDGLGSEERLALLTGERPAARDGELRLVQGDLRRVGYECAYLGPWELGREDSRHRDFERWVVTRRDTDWEAPALMVERAVMQYETPLDELLTEFAELYLGQLHPRPIFLTLALPETRPRRDYSASIARVLAAVEGSPSDRPTLLVRVAAEGDGRMSYTLRLHAPGESGSSDSVRQGAAMDLAPTLREAAGLRSSQQWPGISLHGSTRGNSR